MADNDFIRVKDNTTKHEYDVHIQALDEEKHTPLDDDRWPPVSSPRRPLHYVDLQAEKKAAEAASAKPAPKPRAAAPKKTTASESTDSSTASVAKPTDEGASPTASAS